MVKSNRRREEDRFIKSADRSKTKRRGGDQSPSSFLKGDLEKNFRENLIPPPKSGMQKAKCRKIHASQDFPSNKTWEFSEFELVYYQ